MRAYVPKVSVLFLILATFACGASQRDAAITAAVTTVNASRDAFAAYDAAEQMKIVAAATSREEGEQALAKHRAGRLKITVLIGSAYRAIAIAATVNDQPTMDGVKTAIAQLLDAIIAFNVGGDK